MLTHGALDERVLKKYRYQKVVHLDLDTTPKVVVQMTQETGQR